MGVTTGPPKVYLVFWGSQWGSQANNRQGYLTLSGDPNGMAPYYQAFVKGLGTNSELWSGVMTQYCEGVAVGSQSCPDTAAHVGYPAGGALAGVWADTSVAAPASATAAQIGSEAVNAAGHFGNTTPTANRNVQYVVVSPTGTHPDMFPSSGFCAWHSSTNSQFGSLAFTNMPYVNDAGASCGANYVNAGTAGTLDGVSIIGGHEYAETITDQFPVGGWTDSSGNENGDKCAWIRSGQGAAGNLALATGAFAVQSTWANDFAGGAGGCEVSHPIFGVTVTNDFSVSASPTSLSVLQGAGANTTISTATVSGNAQSLTLSVSGLPGGASAGFNPANLTSGNASTLTLTAGAATPAGTYPITVTATGSATHSTSVSFTVTAAPPSGQAVTNGGFETGFNPGWSTAGASETVVAGGHNSNFAARLGNTTATNGDSTMSQTITVPANATLSFWYQPHCPDTISYDQQQMQVRSSTGAILATELNICSNTGVWTQLSTPLNLAGQTVQLWFNSHDDNFAGDPTYLLIDDVSVTGTAPLNDFSVSASPTSLSVVQGAGANTTISTATVSGNAQSLTLSVSGLPGGASAGFNPANLTSGNASTLTLTAGAATTAGTYPITVTATGSATHSTSVSFTVTAPVVNDFSVSASPTSLSVLQGAGANTTISTATVSGNAQSLTLSVSGLPGGASAGFNPANLTSGNASTLTLTAGAATTAGTYPITVTATGSATHSTSVSFTVTAPVVNDFSVSASPTSLSVLQGAGANTTISTATVSGNAQSLTLSVSGLPGGASAGFNPANLTSGNASTLTLTAGAATPAGTYPITVTATGSATHSTSVSFTVTAAPPSGQAVTNGGFETGFNPGWSTAGASETVVAGGHNSNFAARLGNTTATNGDSTMSQTITVPANATLSFWYQPHCPDTISYDQQQMQVRSSTGAILATELNICSNTGVWTQFSTPLNLAGQTVQLWFNSHDDNFAGDPTYLLIDDVSVTGTAPLNDFSVSASPTSLSVVQGAGANTTISTATVSGNAQSLTLSVSGLPGGASAGFNPANLTSGNASTLTLTAGAATTAGTYPITVTATGSATHSTSVSFTVTAPVVNDFSVSASPTSLSVLQGAGANTTISTATVSGNAQSLTLSVSGLPGGASAGFNPANLTSGNASTLTLTAGAATTAGTYPITVTATGSATHSTSVSFTVTAAPPSGQAVTNGGFETGFNPGWSTAGASETVVAGGHNSNFAARLGNTTATNGDSTMSQTITVPANATLSFWYQPHCPDTISYDQQQMQVRSSTGAILATELNICSNTGVWTQFSTPLNLAGQTVQLWFNSHDDNFAGDPTYLLIDDVSVTATVAPPRGPGPATSPSHQPSGHSSVWTDPFVGRNRTIRRWLVAPPGT